MKKLLTALLLWVSIGCFADTNKTAVISIPKCGNFLLMKLMQMISKKQPRVSSPYNLNLDWANYFTLNHESVKTATTQFCKEKNVKVVFIFRDPRDQVVSGAYYLKKIGHVKNVSIPDLITSLINNSFHRWRIIGLPAGNGTVTDFYDLLMQWSQLDFVYATTFEKIIGVNGGGDRQIQIEEIKNIATFCGYVLSEAEVGAIADSLWGVRNTFREGKVGSWKKEFNLGHKNLFKKIAGQLLIDLGYEKDLNW